MVVVEVVVNGTPRTDPDPQQSQLLVTVCGPFISFSLFQGPFLFCCPSFFEEPQGQIWPGPDLNMGHINFSSPGHLGGGLKEKKKSHSAPKSHKSTVRALSVGGGGEDR